MLYWSNTVNTVNDVNVALIRQIQHEKKPRGINQIRPLWSDPTPDNLRGNLNILHILIPAAEKSIVVPVRMVGKDLNCKKLTVAYNSKCDK